VQVKINNLKINKMTVVEFLVDNFHYYYSTKWNDIIEQAKEMEKQQIITAYNKAVPFKFGKEYYDETFKKE
jgi:hypothetical protein